MKRRRRNMKRRIGRTLEYVAHGQRPVGGADRNSIKAGEKASMFAKQKKPSKIKLRRSESRNSGAKARKF